MALKEFTTSCALCSSNIRKHSYVPSFLFPCLITLVSGRSSTTPVQRIVTTAKGVAIDYDNVSRDAQGFSKEFYLWGQTDNDDVKDGMLHSMGVPPCTKLSSSL